MIQESVRTGPPLFVGTPMDWEQLPLVIDEWLSKSAAPAYAIRQRVADTITGSYVHVYYDPVSSRTGLFAPLAPPEETNWVKAAVCRGIGRDDAPLSLSYQDLRRFDSTWVKVAQSQTLRRAGELLNFFPGQYAGGIPNSPSPVAAMLTAGLLGAGLGYGGGRLIGSALPEGYGKKLGRTGAVLGGLVGSAPGLLWALANKADGRSFNDSTVLSPPAESPPDSYPTARQGTNALSESVGPFDAADISKRIREMLTPSSIKRGADEVLGRDYLWLIEKAASTFGTADPVGPRSPADVNIDALGRTLWDSEAGPALTGTTMAGMYAAQQFPDPHARPGWVTGNQLGQLAANAAGDYTKGYLVGAAINTLVGTPLRRSSFGLGGIALGIIGAVVPKLFGR
jgi:hypothetical protein